MSRFSRFVSASAVLACAALCAGAIVAVLVAAMASAEAENTDAEQQAAEPFVPATKPLEARNPLEPFPTPADAVPGNDWEHYDLAEQLRHNAGVEADGDRKAASRWGVQFAAQKHAERAAGLAGIGETALP